MADGHATVPQLRRLLFAVLHSTVNTALLALLALFSCQVILGKDEKQRCQRIHKPSVHQLGVVIF